MAIGERVACQFSVNIISAHTAAICRTASAWFEGSVLSLDENGGGVTVEFDDGDRNHVTVRTILQQ